SIHRTARKQHDNWKTISERPKRQSRRKAKEIAEIKELTREHMPAAIEALVSIMSNPKASDAGRVSAATTLHDRGYGASPTSPRPIKPRVVGSGTGVGKSLLVTRSWVRLDTGAVPTPLKKRVAPTVPVMSSAPTARLAGKVRWLNRRVPHWTFG